MNRSALHNYLSISQLSENCCYNEFMIKFNREHLTFTNVLPYVLLVCGLFGLLASSVLTYEKIEVLKNPAHIPACSINPIISCGSVMNSPFSEILGVPFPLFGLAGFTALALFGFLLASGSKVKEWIWLLANLAALGGVLFVHALIYESVFVIKAICPWCFGVWLTVILVFWGLTIHNMREGNFGAPRGAIAAKFNEFVVSKSVPILLSWYALVLGLLLIKFWYFWSTLIP